MTMPSTPADAPARSWVQSAPGFLQPYLRLMRADRPVGTWLLFWPCVLGCALAGERQRDIGADLRLIALFAVGAFVMRGAGCTYNDIVDRDIDAQVARTRGRPLPSGAVSLRSAWIFLALQCAVGLAVLLQLNGFAMVLGASSLALIAAYPFMKRITWWPQAWLGLTFNWGALLGYAAKTGHLALPACLLYVACIFWTLGYDTIYAHQDKDDDALIGVKSSARRLGEASHTWIAIFYMLTTALLFASAEFVWPGSPLPWLVIFVGAHFTWQLGRLDTADPNSCLRIFRSNRDAGALMAAALLLCDWLR